MQLVCIVTRHVLGDELDLRPIELGCFATQELAIEYCVGRLADEGVEELEWTQGADTDALIIGDFTVTPVQVYTTLSEVPPYPAIPNPVFA